LDGDDRVDLGQLGEIGRRHVDHHPGGDVVGNQRKPRNGFRDRLEMGPQAGLVRLVVIRGDDQGRLGASLGRSLGQLDRVAGGGGGGGAKNTPPPPPISSTPARSSEMCSRSSSVAASPLEPATTTPCEP